MKTRHCPHCARPLARTARANAKYCSDACRAAHWHRRARTARALARKRKCAVCGKRIMISARSDMCFSLAKRRSILETDHKVIDIAHQPGFAPQPALHHQAFEPKAERIS